jgi:hypothetical protein
MADLDATLGVASPAEQNLVEKSQDSVRVTKQRLHRASMTQDKEEEAEDSGEHTVDPRQDSIAHARRRLGHTEVEGAQASKVRKKPKTRFSTETECHDSVGLGDGSMEERKRSIGRRISKALTFKKMGKGGPSEEVEASPPSIHVKFQQNPQVIE